MFLLLLYSLNAECIKTIFCFTGERVLAVNLNLFYFPILIIFLWAFRKRWCGLSDMNVIWSETSTNHLSALVKDSCLMLYHRNCSKNSAKRYNAAQLWSQYLMKSFIRIGGLSSIDRHDSLTKNPTLSTRFIQFNQIHIWQR